MSDVIPSQPSSRCSGRVAILAAIVFFTVLSCYRFSLIDRGHFAWGDERYYLPAEKFVDSMATGDTHTAALAMFEARGPAPPARPGFILISVCSVLFQRLVAIVADIDPATLAYYDAAAGFNVLVAMGISACVYLLGWRWTGNRWYALAIAVTYSMLCNANMWIRHLVPYNESLLLFLSALCLLARPDTETRRHIMRGAAAGTLTALGFACYPGYYAFVLINMAVCATVYFSRKRVWLSFGVAASVVALLLEAAARYAGGSYLIGLFGLGGTISMGLPSEGFAFLWRYMRDVEGGVGMMFYGLALLFLTTTLWRRSKSIPTAARVALLAATGCYLFHATMGAVFGGMVFYGRILMMYLPFVVLSAWMGLALLNWSRFRIAGAFVLIVLSAASFQGFARSYARQEYPADLFFRSLALSEQSEEYPAYVLWDIPPNQSSVPAPTLGPEFSMLADTTPGGSDSYVQLDSHVEALTGQARYIGVNLKWMFKIRQADQRFVAPSGYVLIEEAVHPGGLAATAYEGHKPWERRRLVDRRYTMRLYERRSRQAASVPNAIRVDARAD